MTDKWFTTQLRVRQETHDYLAAQAKASHISITQAAGAILEHAREQGWQIGPVTVIRHPAEVVRESPASTPGTPSSAPSTDPT